MDYYKVRERERNERIEASVERNRQRSRDRYLASKK
jgi:hypothetical protein